MEGAEEQYVSYYCVAYTLKFVQEYQTSQENSKPTAQNLGSNMISEWYHIHVQQFFLA